MSHAHQSDQSDPLGQALLAYWATQEDKPLTVLSEDFDPDQINVSYFFRTVQEMPDLERLALNHCRGRVLDIGSGAGVHALHLQQAGFEVVSVDSSPGACDVQKQQGIHSVFCSDILQCQNFPLFELGRFDTILLLMNGIGVAGSLDGLTALLKQLKRVLNPGGQILFDSSDVAYLYDSAPPKQQEFLKANRSESGCIQEDEKPAYYGQITYQFVYEAITGKPFDWLFIDLSTLEAIAQRVGLKLSILQEGEHHDYLARLTNADEISPHS